MFINPPSTSPFARLLLRSRYILVHGNVDLMLEKDGLPFTTLKAPNSFGQRLGFQLDKDHASSAQAANFCDLYRLEKNDLCL